jgi:hypothetical protein
MRKVTSCLMLLCSAVAAVGSVAAQERAAMTPPKVLTITREFLKPGKAGPLHVKTESAFVKAMAAANWPQHYFAMDSLTGAPRSLFLTGYDSFAAWEKDNQATEKNAALSAALSKAAEADGELLTAIETTALVFREDQSFHPGVDIAKYRYFEITRFKVHAGHDRDWDAIVKIYKDTYEKIAPDTHWAVYEDMFGKDSGGIFLVIEPKKSLAEIDADFGTFKKFSDSVGEEGMKKLAELEVNVDALESNTFAFNPSESYPPPEWVKSDPDFWKAKPAAPAAKPEKKPAP